MYTIIDRSSTSAIVLYNDQFFKVSDNGNETLIFKCDENGSVAFLVEIGGGRGLTLDEVLEDFPRWCWGL